MIRHVAVLTQIILEVSVFLVHDDFIHRYPLLVARLHFTVVFSQHDRPQRRQRQVEQIAGRCDEE